MKPQSQSLSKIPYTILSVSSEYNCDTLSLCQQNGKGWQSTPNCTYPQEIFIQLNTPAKIKQMHLLSHQSKIASNVEIYITQPNKVVLHKLGNVKFGNNEKNGYKSRELKVVKMDCQCDKVKFVFARNYENGVNVSKQVGVVMIELYGEVIKERELKIMRMEEEIKELKKRKEEVVKIEDFDEAKEIVKKIEKKLKDIEKLKKGEGDDIKNEQEKGKKDKGKGKGKGKDKGNKKEKDVKKSVNKRYTKDDEDEEEEEEEEEENEEEEEEEEEENEDDEEEEEEQNSKKATIKTNKSSSKPAAPSNIKSSTTKSNKNTKNIIDVDSQKVGNHLTFSQLLEKQLTTTQTSSPSTQPPTTTTPSPQEQSLSEADKSLYTSLQQYLPKQTILSLLSKQSKPIEDTLTSLLTDLPLHPKSKLFSQHHPPLTSITLISTRFFSQSLIQPILLSISLLSKSFSLHKPSSSDKSLLTCIEASLDLLGHSSPKVKNAIEELIITYISFTKTHKQLLHTIITGTIKKSLQKSASHLNARYKMVYEILKRFPYEKDKNNTIIKYAISGYANSKINVREIALEIIAFIYAKEGNVIREFFKELRPAQINTIEERLDKVDKGDNNNNDIKASNITNNNNNNGDSSQLFCSFCGMTFETLTEELLMLHQYKECPMLILCTECQQIIEISKLHNHLLTECSSKSKYKECSICKHAIQTQNMSTHLTTTHSSSQQETTTFTDIHCPLCNVVIDDSDIWRRHFIMEGCPNNKRTNTD